jgi:bla regulator protein BlaR1
MTRHGELPDGPPHPPNARGANQMAATTTMARLAMQLSMAMVAGRPVIDKTNLDGQFDIFLYYAPVSPEGNDRQIDAPILTDAVQQQLGLKLQPAKEQMPVIAVDHIEKTPTEN